ncbi:FtsX-like permease family protein [Candidatus Peregrinibacteria bacterium]|jgi:putative ABC transport system permease protein|nr:FtsX-like permease family protein [Candidatus Magasanikbacteria bacterium]MBT4937108.1 FtsX-like permease family protein [Candidatus Peregrinibacteria bacterium]MBT4221305.1 FtsX-like permease family protein [Candidatus Magasanikbacteria bacterium]MBT4350847.1 FtsX-like permease family protein [Candidatus Magasanikbacteria bacterium]MBT4542153.1 FtsX-like permease family protein [Candidatus Magasanikbacteria bacterium]
MRGTYAWKMAYKNLLVNKRRSFLTMLGIIIGIMSVVLVMSVGAGAQSLILNQIQQRGTDQIAILAGASEENGPPAQALGIVVTTLTYDDGLALLKKNNVKHVEAVAGYLSGNDVLSWENQEESVNFTGTTASYKEVEKIEMKTGRFFTDEEDTSGIRVVVLGSTIAENVFGNQNPIGESVKIQKKKFKVIGVMEEKGTSVFENPDEAVLIPLTVTQRDLLGVRHVSFLRLKIEGESYISQTVEEIKQTLIERHGEEDFSIRNIADALTILENITNALRFFLVAIAGVALFVGGVGIMNIMLIAVKEKTREIGLRKSVGAKNKDILNQFLIETFLITCVGTVVGILGGVIIAFFIALIVKSQGFNYDFVVSPVTMIVSFVLAGIISILFGIVPAKKAASLDPITALRYE